MGKNRDRESLIRNIVNVVVHMMVIENTNKPESKNHLDSEIIEYRSNVEKTLGTHNWNNEDKKYVEEKSLKLIKNKLENKYSDVRYKEDKLIDRLKEMLSEMM